MNINRLRLVLVSLLIITSGTFVYTLVQPATTEVDTFDECVKAGYPVRGSDPRECTTFEGEVFTAPGHTAGGSE